MDAVKLEKALLDLTPGGSEYHGSPQRCLDWIKDRISMTGKLAAERNQYRAAGDELALTVAEFTDMLTPTGARHMGMASEYRRLRVALLRWREVTK